MTGLQLKKWRKNVNLTQNEVALLLKVSRKTANSYESRENIPTLSEKLLDFLLNESKHNQTTEANEPTEIYSNNDFEIASEAIEALENWLEKVKKQPESVKRIMEEFEAKKELKKLKENISNNGSSKAS